MADRAFGTFSVSNLLTQVNGWLIFALPPAEAAFHPAEHNSHELYFMCEDLNAEITALTEKGVKCGEVQQERWGFLSAIELPSGAEIRIYQPEHPTALSLTR